MALTAADKLVGCIEALAHSRDDERAWGTLFSSLWPLVFSTSYRILRANRDLAEDASQDVFLRILRYARFQDFTNQPEAFKSYVRTICKNVCLTYLTQLVRQPTSSSHQRDEVEKLSDKRRTDVETTAIHRDQLSALLADLRPEDVQLLGLLKEGRTISEISERLGISYSNAAVRIHRLRQFASNYLKTI